MKTVRFGIIGCGLMGREFASAAARWCHLLEMDVRPEVVAVCGRTTNPFAWYRDNFPSIKQFTVDYKTLLANPEVEAVYVALPHHLHREVYCAVIEAGKHLLGEKPFGIDQRACDDIVACARRRPKVFVRCSSQSPFFPAMQRVGGMIERKAFGQVIELNTGFLHSSDLDPNKPINWKRTTECNGEYGVMGDLGLHACHLAFRAGWVPRNVRAILSHIIKERPDGKGNLVPSQTWDNATLLCEAADPDHDALFPWTLRTHRIAPGQKNNWYAEICGTKASARWTSVKADILEVMDYNGGEQIWGEIQTGHETAFKSITGGIFQFGFSDAILQMWAAFLYELAHGAPLKKFAGCATPGEVVLSHHLFTAALESQRSRSVVSL
ncbi:MAG TPA: Gfo/Idh/MocA family oxidoreductase [Candidatus Saccharimonadales bacterium]|nr:Gfo/Idh/MocA family oxidoreductase [Candidatus Saccharimonadales bacterium]